MRIFHVISGFENGGVEALIAGVIANMPPADVHIVAHDAGVEACVDRFRALGVTLHFVPCRKNPFAHMRALKRLFSEYQPSIVHVHTTERGFLPLRAARACGVPVRIQHSHAARPFKGLSACLYAPLFWMGKRAATHYVACGYAAAVAAFGKKDTAKGKVTILKNGIDLSAFAFDGAVREATRAALNLATDTPVVGMVARFSRQKNHRAALRIFSAYQKKHNDAVLLLVGEGNLKPKIERMTYKMHLQSHVLFLGIRSDLPALYAAMDRLILPSYFEGFPIVLIEAAASGLPAVAASTISREVDVAGLLAFCDAKDPAAWCDALETASTVPRATGISAAAVAGFDIQNTASALSVLYRSVL